MNQQTCDDAFHDFIANCESTLKINAGLEAGHDYTVQVETSSGKVFAADLTADTDGALSINTTDNSFPEDFFSAIGTTFELRIYDGGKLVQMKLSAWYNRAVFFVKGGNLEKSEIGAA